MDALAPAVVKAAKPKAVRKPKVAPKHPPFKTLIKAAIIALKERTGSSVAAIKKWFAGQLTYVYTIHALRTLRTSEPPAHAFLPAPACTCISKCLTAQLRELPCLPVALCLAQEGGILLTLDMSP